MDALAHHIATHLVALERLEQHGYTFGPRQVRLLARPDRAKLADRVAERLSGSRPSHGWSHSGVVVDRATLDHPYYSGVRFMIDVQGTEGSGVPLIDGGAFDWLQKLTSDRKLTFVASGMGSQLIPLLFRAQNVPAMPTASPDAKGRARTVPT